MKLCMSHYIHKSIHDAKFEAHSSFSFGKYDATKFPSKEGNKSSNSAIYPRKTGLTLKKKSFYVQNRSSLPRIDPLVNFSNFQEEEILSFSKFSGRLDEKRAAVTPSPRLINFAKIWSEHVLRIKTKSHKSLRVIE